MVAIKRVLPLAAACAGLVCAQAAPAESILKQMQQEISSIAGRSRKAVVTVEDGALYASTPRAPGAPVAFLGAPKSGSGFSLGDDYVLTTADVLAGMSTPTVVTDDGSRYRATVVGMDQELNVGLLRLQAKAKANLPALKLGDSAAVKPGYFGITIGNQSGQDNSVALMIIGGIRDAGTRAGSHYYPHLMQIAGTVGAGASGAPLLDADGNVIAILAGVPADGWAWTTFSSPPPGVPMRPLEAPGTAAPKPGPNRKGDAPPPDGRQAPGNADPDVVPNLTLKPGADALPGDPYVGILMSGTPDPATMHNWINRFPNARFPAIEGAASALDVARSTASLVWPVNRPAVTSAGFAVPINDIRPVVEALRSGKPVVRGWLGIQMQDQPEMSEDGGRMTVKNRVRISQVMPNSPAARAGLQVGDVLVRVNGKPIQSSADVVNAVLYSRPGDSVRLEVSRAAAPKSMEIRLDARPEQPRASDMTGKVPVLSDIPFVNRLFQNNTH